MAQRKAHEVDSFLRNPEPRFRTILIYGPNSGLVSECAGLFAKRTGVDLEDPFCLIRLDADSVAGNPNKITEDAHTVSMFGGSRLIWISGSTLKNLTKSIEPILSSPPEDAWILIEAGDLKKTSPLRKQIEKATSAIALPCYSDDARSLNALIDDEVQKGGLKIDTNARNLLNSLIGADRRASRNEIEKLCLYAHGKESISVEDVEAIVGDASAFAIDEVVDAASIGDLNTVQETVGRLFETGTHASVIALAAQRHFQALHKARAEMEFSRQPAQSVMARMRPPPMFKRKDNITAALNIWHLSYLEKTLERLEKTCFESRANSHLANSIVNMALMAISIEAARHKSRR